MPPTVVQRRSELQIFDAGTRGSSTRLSATLAKTSFISSVPLEIEPALSLKHADGDFPDVAQKLHDIDAEFVTRAATAKSQSDAVQFRLDLNVSAINTSIGTFQSNLATEIAQQQAAQETDTAARAQLDTDLRALVTAEAATAHAAESANADAVAQLQTALATQVAAEEAALVAAVANVQSQLDFVKSNADPSAVDSIAELLALASGDPDSSLAAMVTSIRTDITWMQRVVNTLTNDDSLGGDAEPPPDIPEDFAGAGPYQPSSMIPAGWSNEIELLTTGWAKVRNEVELLDAGFQGTVYHRTNTGSYAAVLFSTTAHGMGANLAFADAADATSANFPGAPAGGF